MLYSIFKGAAVASIFICQILAAPQGRGSEDDTKNLNLPNPVQLASELGLPSTAILAYTSIAQTLPKPTALAIAIQSASLITTPTPTTGPTVHKPTATSNGTKKELHREARALAKPSSTTSLAVVMKRAVLWVMEHTNLANP